jgi:hypothetical protein
LEEYENSNGISITNIEDDLSTRFTNANSGFESDQSLAFNGMDVDEQIYIHKKVAEDDLGL